MGITHLFDKNLPIYRLKNAGGNKTTFQSTATVEGALQNKQITERTTQGIITSRQWVAYVDIAEKINKGDQIRYNGKIYVVTDIAPRDYGVNQHLQLDLREANE